jgi:cysteine synthase
MGPSCERPRAHTTASECPVAGPGLAITVVTSDAFSIEKRNHMRALGAEVIEVPSDHGRITRDLIQAMMARAAEIAAQPGVFFADQFNNVDAIAGYAPLGDEIWRQTGGQVDAFVQAVGTSHCINGVAQALRAHDPDVKIIAVEPAESPVLSGGGPGAHRIEGIGPGFVPPLWSPEIANEIIAVPSADAMGMSRRLAKEEALFAGTSSGANVIAALQVAKRLGPGHTVVTLLCDSGLKYVSTELYGPKIQRTSASA